MKKIGCIGFGNMAQAIVQGWLKENVLEPDQIYATAAHFEALQQRCQRYGIHAVKTNLELCQECDIIILAVKPYMIEKAMSDCKEVLSDKMIISLAAGMPFDKIESILPGTHHISVIPNTPISVGQGIVVAQKENSLDQDQLAQFERLFEPVALIAVVETNQLSIAGTIAGCAPAFTAMYIEALSDAGVEFGLPRNLALELSAKMCQGTAAMYLANRQHPGLMKDAVCSPAGTTIKGVSSLEKSGFRGDVIAAIEAIEQ